MSVKIKLGLAIIILSILSLSIGNLDFSWFDLLRGHRESLNVLIVSRIPRLVAVILTGVGLSIGGLIMQQIVHNKFVSPSTTTTASSARLGIMFAIAFLPQQSMLQRSVFAFTFALVGTLMFMWLMQRIKFKDVVFVPLLGMMLGSVIDAITTFLALRLDVMQTLNGFTIGSFTLLIKGRYEMMYLLVLVIIITYVYAKAFNIAALGSDYANNLGLNYKQVVMIGVLIVSLNSAVIVSIVGNISFVGIIIPNLVSRWFGDKVDSTLTLTALCGALFLLVADIISRLIIFPYEVPVSLTIGVIGSIGFILLIMKQVRHE